MRASMIGLSALALAAAASPALAADAAAPAPEFTLTGSAALVSDYRFRGISQSDRRLVPQASATLSHSSGFYVSFWSSAISQSTVYPGANAELDLIGGYTKAFGSITMDSGVLYYVYANADKGVKSDFFEPYGSLKTTFGPVTAKAGFNYSWKQSALALGTKKEDNLYLYGELGAAIPNTPFSVLAHAGHTSGPSYLSIGTKHYTDWNIGASYTWKAATFTVQYVDTNITKAFSVYGPNNRDQAKAGIVGSMTFAF